MDRLAFHEVLCGLLGTRNVYFQPPSDIQMAYPCIVYSRDKLKEDFANNILYNKKKGYSVMVIDANPDSLIPDKIGKLQESHNTIMASFAKHYVAVNLNHDVYSVYI